MKKVLSKVLSMALAFMLVFSSMVSPAVAANLPEVEEYLDTTYANAIDPYGSLQKDDAGRYVIPLSKTSVSLKKDASSKEYAASWSSSDEAYAKITSNYSSSATLKIIHPTAEEGEKVVVLTLTLTDKNDGATVRGTRDFVLAIAPQLPVYHLEVTAKDASGAIIPDASVLVQDSRGIAQYPSGGGYSLKGETEYTLTVSAVGYIRQIQTITLSQDTSLEVTLQQGSSVNFRVTTATGSVTDYATIQVTSLDGSQSFNCVLDEYGYETTLFELKPGTYQYHISYQNDSQTASGQFTVPENQPSVELPVQLSYTQYKVKFAVQPANATVSLYKNGAQGAYGDPILPDENGYYTVIFGQYRYTVEAEGFVTISKTFNATDTSLKENDYVITVKLESYDDKILSNADNLLFEVSGEGMLLQEYTGVHSDIDFGYYADIDSDYDDVNLNDSLESFLSKELAVDGVQVEITDVLNMDYEQDFSVVQKDGTILYSAVADAMVDEDLGGAVFTVSLVLGYGNSTKPSEVTVIVPQHLTSRQERLDAAAEYAILFDTIKGDNTDQNQITAPLTLTDLASDMNEDFWYYSIFSSWESDHPEVINPQTGKVTPAENNTLVTLSVKAYYSAAQIEEAGFLFDPGPLGDNQSIRSITLVVPGTNPADKTILGKVITEANRLKGTEEYTNAISSVKESFDKALADAEDVYDNLAATDKEVTDAWMKLLKEIHKLGFQAGDKTQLQALYDEVKDTDLSQYQDGASKENFQTALANAETVLADKDAMQKEIDKAYDDLKAAYDALEKQADKSQLKALLDKCAEYKEENYTPGTWEVFAGIQEKAQSVYDNTEASQAEINAAVDELLGGMLQLRFKADKTILETVIEAGGKVEGSNYTGESYAALQGALAEAEAVLADENASQEKVDAATEKVRAAIEGLAAVEGATETPSTTDKATQTGQETTTTTAAKTGDVTPIAGLAAITLAGAALLIFRKRAK